MNKFKVYSCMSFTDREDREAVSMDYDGPVVAMGSTTDPALMVFFPTNEENSNIINSVIEKEDGGDDNEEIMNNLAVLSIYKTMIDSWSASGNFLSGIIIDAVYDKECDEDVISVRFTMSNSTTGCVEGLVNVSFIHAVLVSVMENVDIILNDNLLELLLPQTFGDDEVELDNFEDEVLGLSDSKSDGSSFPEDQNVLEIAKQILEKGNGKKSKKKKRKKKKDEE